MKQPIFTGTGTAIITPFTTDSVDYSALGRLIDFQLSGGVDAIIVCGTTGEAATMSYAERMRTIEYTVRRVDGQVPVIAGTGSNNTETAITLSKDAARAGVDGLLVVTPYYNKATQEGLKRHYLLVADSVPLPLIAYNVPSRTGVGFTAAAYAAIAAHPNINGVKEASGSMALVQAARLACPEDFYIWSGNDEDTAAICLFGGKGVISVASNVMPREVKNLTDLALSGQLAEAAEAQLRLKALIDALFMEVNPIPVKTALHMMGRCQEIFRLPMCRMTPGSREKLAAVLRDYGLTTAGAEGELEQR